MTSIREGRIIQIFSKRSRHIFESTQNTTNLFLMEIDICFFFSDPIPGSQNGTTVNIQDEQVANPQWNGQQGMSSNRLCCVRVTNHLLTINRLRVKRTTKKTTCKTSFSSTPFCFVTSQTKFSSRYIQLPQSHMNTLIHIQDHMNSEQTSSFGCTELPLRFPNDTNWRVRDITVYISIITRVAFLVLFSPAERRVWR